MQGVMAGVWCEFGQELRLERERRGISLANLCAETKVNARHLEALEQGNYTALPGGVFRRGIVRAYLHAAGLEEQAWMPRFQASYANFLSLTGASAESDDHAWATFALNVKKNRGKLGDSTRLRWIGVALLLMAVCAAGWAVVHYLLLPALHR